MKEFVLSSCKTRLVFSRVLRFRNYRFLPPVFDLQPAPAMLVLPSAPVMLSDVAEQLGVFLFGIARPLFLVNGGYKGGK
jgi:hypothetical protein